MTTTTHMRYRLFDAEGNEGMSVDLEKAGTLCDNIISVWINLKNAGLIPEGTAYIKLELWEVSDEAQETS